MSGFYFEYAKDKESERGTCRQ